MDRNDQLSGAPRQRPAGWGDGAGTDLRPTVPGERTAGNPVAEGWGGQPPRPGQHPYPGQPQSAGYPPEHAPFARPPLGSPAGPQNGQHPADPRWSGGQHPGYPPPGQQPYPQYPLYQGQPYPQQSGQPYPPGQVPPGYGQGNRPPGPGTGFSAGPPVPPTIGRRRKGSILPALIFGLLAIVLAGIAVYLYVQENDNTGPVAPTAAPAQNQFIQVQNALQDTGLTATTERQNATSPDAFPMREPGQAIRIDGHNAWIYIFPSLEAQEEATAAVPDEGVGPLTTASGTELTTGSPMMFSNSNVIILLSMDDNPGTDVTDKVREAVESLP